MLSYDYMMLMLEIMLGLCYYVLCLCLMLINHLKCYYDVVLVFILCTFCTYAYCLHYNQNKGWKLELLQRIDFYDLKELKMLVSPHSFEDNIHFTYM